MVSTSTTFPDVKSHWAENFIIALAQRRAINGYPDGSFRPDRSVSRAEFATIMAGIFTQPSKREYTPFTDVPSSHWAAKAIQKAYEMGFVMGYPDRTFRPNDKIARGDALVALVNGLQLATNIPADLVSELPQIYRDANNIPDYAKNQVAIATRVGIVTSYPNVNILNPQVAATRADIATTVYQAMVHQGKVAEKIASDYIVPPPKAASTTVTVSHRREFRGAWIASAWNSDWPSKAGLTTSQQQAELIQILEQLKDLNFNAVFFQVRPEGDALYASQLEPWSAWLSGTQGQPPNPYYDPLEFAIAECRKRNLEIHAWFNPYRAQTSVSRGKNATPHIAVTNPEVVYRWGNQLWMDPGSKVVQDRSYTVMMDVLKRYDLDGIHLDDYFYPYPIAGQSFPDNRTYAAYQGTGGKLNLADWRRENVNQMVLRLSQGVKQIKPHVKFGISPFGIYRPGQPAGIAGLDAYNELYADSKKWLEQGWVDYIAPQLYWRTDQAKQSYPTLLQWWTSVNPQKRHIYAGNTLGQLDGKAWKSDEIDKQVRISRSLLTSLSLGNIFFDVDAIVENRQAIAEKLKNTLYNQPALAPTMSWRKNTPPSPPTNVQVSNRRLGWDAAKTPDTRSWALYRQSGDTWQLQRVLSRGTNFATVTPGTYAICAVDRLANESLGTVISVS
jgi:uncharacterized lipoprotein YddW (UPF0748 family)